MREVEHPLSGPLSVVANPLNFSATPIDYQRAPPLLGQHTAEVLREVLALDDAAIERLADAGAIGLGAVA